MVCMPYSPGAARPRVEPRWQLSTAAWLKSLPRQSEAIGRPSLRGNLTACADCRRGSMKTEGLGTGAGFGAAPVRWRGSRGSIRRAGTQFESMRAPAQAQNRPPRRTGTGSVCRTVPAPNAIQSRRQARVEPRWQLSTAAWLKSLPRQSEAIGRPSLRGNLTACADCRRGSMKTEGLGTGAGFGAAPVRWRGSRGSIRRAGTQFESMRAPAQAQNRPPRRTGTGDVRIASSRHFSNWVAHRVAKSGKSCFARTTCAELERRPDADGV